MIAIPVSSEVVRRTLRTAVVAAVAVASLGFSLQGYFLVNRLAPGAPEWIARGNIIIHPGPFARAAGIAVGDRIDYSLIPMDQRYGDAVDGLRWPPVGKPVPYVIEHGGRKRVVTFKAMAWYWAGWFTTSGRLIGVVESASFIVLVLLASMLVLIRPTPLTFSFFLFAAVSGGRPLIYASLPVWGYLALTVLGDILGQVGTIGYLLLAVYLNPPPLLRSRLVAGIALLLLTLMVVPSTASDTLELVQGIRPAWPIAGWASLFGIYFCYVVGAVLLLRLAATVNAPRMLRILAALLAGVGALTIFVSILDWAASAHLNSWYVANFPLYAVTRPPIWGESPGWWLRQALKVVELAGTLLAFYVIIRARVVDTGPVMSRIVASIIIALVLIAAFIVMNIAFAPVLPPLIVPLEIFAAIAIGYWVSGLRDVAGCLSLAGVDAWGAWARGHPLEERNALAHSLGLAQRTRRPGMIAEVRAQAAFSAWRDGNDGEFQQNVEALQRALAGRNMRGLRGFAEAAAADTNELRFAVDDLPEWQSRAALLLCARTNDARRAQQFATDALASADRARLHSLQVLGSIAVAETRPEQRNASLEKAHAIAQDAGWSALSKSILALRANARDIGILQSFVDSRLRKSRPAQPMFEVSFFNAELWQNTARVSLSEKELELLLTVASARTGINDSEVIDTIWPESDGDAARTAFRVCLHRLRKSVGDPRIVSRVGKGYVVHPWADVDLWQFQSLLSTCRESGGLDGTLELRRLCDALRAGKGRRATLGEWFYRFEQMLDRKLDEAERFLGRETTRGARS